jgi:tRNA-methyltransferase O
VTAPRTGGCRLPGIHAGVRTPARAQNCIQFRGKVNPPNGNHNLAGDCLEFRPQLTRVAGLELLVRGLDAVDGTPILDIKPYVSGFQPRGPVREPAWIRELMADYY